MPRSALVRALLGLLVAVLIATGAGLAILWPDRGEVPRPPELGTPPKTEAAEVVGVEKTRCGLGAGRTDCLRVNATLRSGPGPRRNLLLRRPRRARGPFPARGRLRRRAGRDVRDPSARAWARSEDG